MAFESLLATDSLLAMIFGSLSINNLLNNSIRRYLSSLNKYFKKDIRIRNRLERKADHLLNKMGIDLLQFENSIEELKELDKYD